MIGLFFCDAGFSNDYEILSLNLDTISLDAPARIKLIIENPLGELGYQRHGDHHTGCIHRNRSLYMPKGKETANPQTPQVMPSSRGCFDVQTPIIIIKNES